MHTNARARAHYRDAYHSFKTLHVLLLQLPRLGLSEVAIRFHDDFHPVVKTLPKLGLTVGGGGSSDDKVTGGGGGGGPGG